MTERLHNLLLRQSEAGEPAILWGRLAKPFLGKEFDRLLHCGVLIEETPADDWDVCSDCECGHDSRRIQRIDGKLIAACPIDHRSDTVLEPEDLRSFRINLKSLVREIAVASGFTAEPTQVMPGVWYLGVAPAKRGLFLAFTRNNILAPGLISSLRTTGEKLPITIVAPALPAGDLLRFAAAKDAGFLDIALECAELSGVDPSTLVRAARDFCDKEPRFAAVVGLLAIRHLLAGGGYDPQVSEAADAATHLLAAARQIGAVDWARAELGKLADGPCSSERQLFRHAVEVALARDIAGNLKA